MATVDTLVVELESEPLGRWSTLKIDESMLDYFKTVLREGSTQSGINIEFRQVAPHANKTPVCPTCEGKDDCQIEGKYPNGEGCGYFVECPDCEGTGFDLDYELCPYCSRSLFLDVHGQCIEQFQEATHGN